LAWLLHLRHALLALATLHGRRINADHRIEPADRSAIVCGRVSGTLDRLLVVLQPQPN
jgi:hypothetical protein